MAKHRTIRVVCDGHRGYGICGEFADVPLDHVIDAEEHLKAFGWTFGTYDLCWKGHYEEREA